MPPDDPKLRRRMQTSTERDLEGQRARAERDAAVQAPSESFEDITGKYAGEDLEQARARRPTPDRLRLLETKHDELGGRVGKMEVVVADLGGQMKILPELVSTMREATSALQQRETVTFTSKVTVDQAQALDNIDARKDARSRWTKIVGGIVTLLTSGAAIHWLAGKF